MIGGKSDMCGEWNVVVKIVGKRRLLMTNQGYNKKRAERMAQRSDTELERFVESGSLASASAEYELRRRNRKSGK